LFDAPNASYGVHNGKVTFWNKDQRACLRIVPESTSGGKIAVRFSRQPDGVFSLNYSVAGEELIPKHGLSRFRRAEQDIWRPFAVSAGRAGVELTLSAPRYDEAYDRGDFKGVDGLSIREICHTIARVGAVDELILGSNGYYRCGRVARTLAGAIGSRHRRPGLLSRVRQFTGFPTPARHRARWTSETALGGRPG
jgi:hypothetical protein